MPGQVGTVVATLGGLMIWGIGAALANDAACASIDATSFPVLSKWAMKLSLLCWFV